MHRVDETRIQLGMKINRREHRIQYVSRIRNDKIKLRVIGDTLYAWQDKSFKSHSFLALSGVFRERLHHSFFVYFSLPRRMLNYDLCGKCP